MKTYAVTNSNGRGKPHFFKTEEEALNYFYKKHPDWSVHYGELTYFGKSENDTCFTPERRIK